MKTIGIVAYEVSADRLGEGLVKALKQRIPDVEFVGITGPRMEAEGCRSIFPAERMAVMGLVEVIRHLPMLFKTRRTLYKHFVKTQPDLFIGIDAPDFNLGLETRLKQQGIPTVHYVCPTFWAWRSGRVKGLKKAADLVLSIFPFEIDFLKNSEVNCKYVGHPLAEQIPEVIDQAAALTALGMRHDTETIAILPGSRTSEVSRLAGPFLSTAKILAQKRPNIQFVLPCSKPSLRPMIDNAVIEFAGGINCKVLDGDSYLAMSAADIVLTASGTATMEIMMHKKPMVVGYKVSRLSAMIFRRMIKVPFVAMSNLLVGKMLAPELLQEQCRPDLLVEAIEGLLGDTERRTAIQSEYLGIHNKLRQDSANLAADAVVELLNNQNG